MSAGVGRRVGIGTGPHLAGMYNHASVFTVSAAAAFFPGPVLRRSSSGWTSSC